MGDALSEVGGAIVKECTGEPKLYAATVQNLEVVFL